ncbi:MAG: DNA-directed RNA polymerase core subunit rpc10 [Bogoriella megaspora]|nr:MAG: DNA-directed RNA polymerase core subunit rpc10 [Bogoriella megaspora]
MSREAYTPGASSPFHTSNANAQTAGTSNAVASTSFPTSLSTFEDTSRPVQYSCGECDSKVVLKRGDPIRCKECGYRVLYKERTNRMVQFEAR